MTVAQHEAVNALLEKSDYGAISYDAEPTVRPWPTLAASINP